MHVEEMTPSWCLDMAAVCVYAVYAGAGLFKIAAVPNGSEYAPEHRTPLCLHCDWRKYMIAMRQARILCAPDLEAIWHAPECIDRMHVERRRKKRIRNHKGQNTTAMLLSSAQLSIT